MFLWLVFTNDGVGVVIGVVRALTTEIEHCDWFIRPLLLPSPTILLSRDRKRRSHKQNRCSASDSVSLILIVSLYASDCDSDCDPVASENQPLDDTLYSHSASLHPGE